MTVYSYAELERLWIDAGGPASLAPLAAAIAEAESGGNSDAYNGHDTNGRGGTQVSAGLWQISNGTMTPVPGWSNPATNARDAVGKWKAAGGFSPWGTYTSGAYKAFLSGKTTPASSVAGSPTAQLTAAQAASQSDCLWSLGFNIPLIGGNVCILSRSEVRSLLGGAILAAGAMVGFAGLAVLMTAAGMKALPPLGKAAEGVGGALMLVPGAEGAGVAIAAGGKAARNPAAAGRARRTRGARDDAELERRMGQPRENPAMETRAGTVRQDRAQRAAQRSRQRRAAGEEPPF